MNRMVGVLMLLLSLPLAVIRAEQEAKALSSQSTAESLVSVFEGERKLTKIPLVTESLTAEEAIRVAAPATDQDDYLNGGQFGYGPTW